MGVLLTLSLVSCRVTQRNEVGGEAVARIIVEFPQADRCFTDPRVETFEQIKQCLELVTNSKWTIDASGEVIEAVTDLLPEDEAEQP